MRKFFFIIFLFCVNTLFSAERILVADSLYQNSNYSAALNEFLYAISEGGRFNQDFHTNFKIAYCYYKTGNHEHAERRFKLLKNFEHQFDDYIDFFRFKIALQKGVDSEIRNISVNYFEKYPDHFLTDSIRFHMAHYEFDRKNYFRAYNYYSTIDKSKRIKFDKAYILYRLAYCKYMMDYKTEGVNLFERFVRKYPSRKEAMHVVNILEEKKLVTPDNYFNIIDVYINHGKYAEATGKLEGFIKKSENDQDKIKARYYLLKVYFAQKEYQTALIGFKNIYELVDKNLKSGVLLYIARAHLRLDNMQESAEAYIQYGELYPRKRLAPETIWKAAWIYEELHDLENALRLYIMIPEKWSRSGFANESRFRAGFSYFRLGYYNSAIEVFKNITRRNSPDWQKNRALYWKAITLDHQGKFDEAGILFQELGQQIFYDYYTMRSYLRYKTEIDSMLQVQKRLSSRLNPLDGYQQYFPSYIQKFNKLFLIKELLGLEMVRMELKKRPVRPASRGEWITLAEIYKRLGMFEKSFQIYDFIDYSYYADFEDLDKPFILKEMYPLYFDIAVQKYAKVYDIDKNFLLAIIREESGFNKWAHSWADAYGLMQIIPPTAQSLASRTNSDYNHPYDLFDENLNLKLGTYYLKSLLRQFNEKKEKALAAYNAGPHRVSRWQKYPFSDNLDFFVENIEFSQTRHYVRRVLRNYWIYQLLGEI